MPEKNELLLTDKEIRVLMAEEYNASEVDMFPDFPEGRNEYRVDNVCTWPHAYQDDRMIRNSAKFQLSKILAAGYLSPEEVEAKIEETRKKERERVMRKLEKEYPAITSWPCWQAL